MLKSLRTKGLSLRHWRMIGAKLGFSFDPATMTLWKLINMKMHAGNKDLFFEDKLVKYS